MVGMNEVLIVDDNILYREAALHAKSQLHRYILKDFKSASNLLDEKKFDAAVIDVFFPYDSECILDFSLFETAVDLLKEIPRLKCIEDHVTSYREIIKLNQTTIPILRNLGRYNFDRGNINPKNNSTYTATKRANENLGKHKATKIFINSTKDDFNNNEDFDMYGRDSIRDIYEAMQKDPSNQPLGIVLGNKLSELEIPFVLATSTHHHDILTQPIQEYCDIREWKLFDSMGLMEKSNPDYWTEVYEVLNKRFQESLE